MIPTSAYSALVKHQSSLSSATISATVKSMLSIEVDVHGIGSVEPQCVHCALEIEK